MNGLYRIFILSLVILNMSHVYACDGDKPKVKDTINYSIAKEQWVESETAKLVVNVYAAVGASKSVDVRKRVIDELNQAIPAKWYATHVSLREDKAGVQQLNVHLQARLPQAMIGPVHKILDDISKPGIKYRVMQLIFEPSLAETQAVYAKLREATYQDVLGEVARLEKLFPQKSFYIHRLFLGEMHAMPAPMPTYQRKAARADYAMEASAGMVASAPSMHVRKKVVLPASVVLAVRDKAKKD